MEMIQSQRQKAPASLGITPIELHAPLAVQNLSIEPRDTPRKTDGHVQNCDSSHFYTWYESMELHLSPGESGERLRDWLSVNVWLSYLQNLSS